MENNKIFNLLDKAIQILGRCWDGYKPVAGVKPYEAGSCEKEMATQSDLNQIQKVIDMLDKAIQFYDPNQPRDASGRWGGGGGGAGGSSANETIKDRYDNGTIGPSGSYDWKEGADEVVDGVNEAFKGTGIKIKKDRSIPSDQGVLMNIFDGAKKIGEHFVESGDEVIEGLKKSLKKTKYNIVTEVNGDTEMYELRPKK